MTLQLDGLVLRQGTFELRADLAIPKGARVAVMGPSGGGKSTLLAAIAGFLDPAAGRILWDGRDLGPLSPGERPVAMLFQDQNLFPHLTLAENAGLALAPRRRLSGPERDRVEEALEAVGLRALGARRPAEVSGGQQSRAALARTLLMDRPLVLLDEPYAALGPALGAEMLALTLATLGARGATLMLVTHDPDEARALGDVAIVVADAAVTAPAPVHDLLAAPPPTLAAYLGRAGAGAR